MRSIGLSYDISLLIDCLGQLFPLLQFFPQHVLVHTTRFRYILCLGLFFSQKDLMDRIVYSGLYDSLVRAFDQHYFSSTYTLGISYVGTCCGCPAMEM